MTQDVEATALRIWQELLNNPGEGGYREAMKLKMSLELSASKFFLALGWLLREGKVEIEPSEFGYKLRCGRTNPLDDRNLIEKATG